MRQNICNIQICRLLSATTALVIIKQQSSMLIQLNKDPLFTVSESPIKAIKDKEIQRMRKMKERRINPIHHRKEVDIEIVNPLKSQLQNYRTQTSIKNSVQSSKASESLKRYVIQQEKNLRCLRLDRISFDEKVSNSRLKSLALNVSHIEDGDKNGKQIQIPRIEDLFKNQSKEILIYENTSLRQKLGKMMGDLEKGMAKFKTLTYSHAPQHEQQPKTSFDLNHSSTISHEDYQMDKIIEKKLQKSKGLIDKLYDQRRQMSGLAPGEGRSASKANNMSYFLREVEKPKRKEQLKGVRTYSYKDGGRDLKLTNASILLFQMNKLYNQKQKKQYELTGLLKNSYQNRDSILKQKQIFYESQNSFSDLSPSKQFQLRKVMNKKLDHRLQISKQQVNKFIAYLSQIKNYHVILNETILQILKEVRNTLLTGKVMKITDLHNILSDKSNQHLKDYPNDLIVKTLTEMMI